MFQRLGRFWAWLSGSGQPARREPPIVKIPREGTVAVLVAARNEETGIEDTIRSLLAAVHASDIYVFADQCTDATVEIARQYLPEANVIDHPTNVGKSRGLQYLLTHRVYLRNYRFVAVIDADSAIEPDYVVECMKVMRNKGTVGVVGKVITSNYPQNIFAVYRSFVYFVWEEIVKRLGSVVEAMPIASGTSTMWRVSALRRIEFDHRFSTEDFYITFQVHRRRLGMIKYASSAVVYSQDPPTFRSYRRQVYRWARAWWEGLRRYRVGLRWFRFEGWKPVGVRAIDILAAVLVFGAFGFWLRLFSLPVFLVHPVDVGVDVVVPGSREAAARLLLFQLLVLVAPFFIVAAITRRWHIALWWPALAALMVVDLVMSVRALGSVLVSLYPKTKGGSAGAWVSPDRLAPARSPVPRNDPAEARRSA